MKRNINTGYLLNSMRIMGILVIGIFLITIASADLGTFKSGQDVSLIQTCNNCTTCNLSTINYPNSTEILTNQVMTQDGTKYNFTLIGNYTSPLGEYKYCYVCGNSEETATGCIDFTVTPRGEDRGGYGWIGELAVWIIVYMFVYFIFIAKSKVPLYNFIGFMLLLINSIIGITLLDTPIGFITLGATVILAVDRLYKFLYLDWND